MRRSAFLLLATVLGALVAPVGPAAAQVPPSPLEAEREFVARINGLRAAKGLPQLGLHPELTAVARSWAAAMARVDRISHNPKLDKVVQADWQKLGENVGVGTTVGELHAAFVASPTHYRNLVEPRYRHVGVGVVVGRGGALFTAHQFMQLRPSAPASRATATPAPSSSATGDAATRPFPELPSAVPLATARLVLVLHLLRALDSS
ncbi:MAG: CAP domain-containing protein [Actinobacteria bacterium]|nr:CAP domain-containing protein [Actinomycetota bacterium]MBW3649008.1 CAP domain-containing protein [Actinomycetota bacterium]